MKNQQRLSLIVTEMGKVSSGLKLQSSLTGESQNPDYQTWKGS